MHFYPTLGSDFGLSYYAITCVHAFCEFLWSRFSTFISHTKDRAFEQNRPHSRKKGLACSCSTMVSSFEADALGMHFFTKLFQFSTWPHWRSAFCWPRNGILFWTPTSQSKGPTDCALLSMHPLWEPSLIFLMSTKDGPKRLLSHKISIYLRTPLNPGKVQVFCAPIPSLVVEAWILVGYVWNLVGEVQNLVALQTVW